MFSNRYQMVLSSGRKERERQIGVVDECQPQCCQCLVATNVWFAVSASSSSSSSKAHLVWLCFGLAKKGSLKGGAKLLSIIGEHDGGLPDDDHQGHLAGQ